MMMRWIKAVTSGLAVLGLAATNALAGSCLAERPEPLIPVDLDICNSLEADIRNPSGFLLDVYEEKLNGFLGHYCHRNAESGWVRDKSIRDTGPFTAALDNGRWQGSYHGTHAPVVIWYSPEMLDWLVTNRTTESPAPDNPPPVPKGAVMIKEMFPAPAGDCAGVDPLHLFPTNGAAVMVRDPDASFDGWFWGWYGFGASSGWAPDWPAGKDNSIPNMGFAQYCMNCHASAENNLTFASPKNIEGQPGRPLVFLSQNFFDEQPALSHHETVSPPDKGVLRLGRPHDTADMAVIDALMAYTRTLPPDESVAPMPSQTYDNSWVSAGGPKAADTFLTSSQCLGCHDAGSTGLQFDMTKPNPHGNDLANLSPYATWRTSPMGLAGRDPFFFAQMASETQTFHAKSASLVETTCLGCHGVTGERQFNIDTKAAGGACAPFRRSVLDTMPWADGGNGLDLAKYAMLARDGVSCTACHRIALGDRATDEQAAAPENACVAERQALLNPDNTGFARTFTGSFLVGPPDNVIGPFEKPRTKPMEHAMGITPQHHNTISSSEICGSCHTVHLPVLRDGEVLGHIYEQTTYPEWAFSAYRTGATPDGALPMGPGADPKSCQECHMPSRDANGVPYRSKMASIQEYSNFPQAEHNLPPEQIDLPVRDGFALHTLVGLNVFLIEIAQQFPDLLGIPTHDPMLGAKGTDPLLRTEQAMLEQARDQTATISISDIRIDDTHLHARVDVVNKAGHKFPSGVGFRRAFLEFSVLDAKGEVLWRSGRTNAAGALVDDDGLPLAGEYWWQSDCSARVEPEKRLHQPHYETITSQSQAQIYQELVAAPGGETPICGPGSTPSGELTTSFLSICTTVKDNRIFPKGYLGLNERLQIAKALGAGEDLAREAGAVGVGSDAAYEQGGSDSLDYEIELAELAEAPASVQSTLYYQAAPPFYLQDRFCTASGSDVERLRYMVGRLNLNDTPAEGWKLIIATSGAVPVR
ncbi:hypothetical protein MAXJ12_00282 [Mesorhizobium alhagi CCNWXJ12-2]|jgi:hypothetical protein|uniref:Uncharacterized protein n=2 Tax=Allomesorhizobium alhagi TaxID=475067 RepID=H0HIV2_9HYPH|nr:hypothetical protein MAXJ12_00282 [Mesorhizobium alhagi CCNWXJ12-2]